VDSEELQDLYPLPNIIWVKKTIIQTLSQMCTVYHLSKKTISIDSIIIHSQIFFVFQLAISQGMQAKGKAIPLHAWTGPKGSRKLRLPDFKTINT
jgi:hypothetical protein